MKRRDAGKAGKIKVNLSLDAELARRLKAYAGHSGVAASAVVAEALRGHLRGFSVRHDKAPGPAETRTPGADAPQAA